MSSMTSLRRSPVLAGTVMLVYALLAGCQHRPAPSPGRYELHIAHINDHHSHLDAQPDFDLRVAGIATRVEAAGFPRLTTLFKMHAERPNLLKLHAGDAMTGTLYHTLYNGEADAALMNGVCFDAFELGNHEFDEGDAGLRRFLDHLRTGSCRTPVLAANVQPAIGTPLAPHSANDYLQPYVIKSIGGVPVGIIGLEVRDKTQQSSRPLTSTRFDDEAATAQHTIAQLQAQGVRHIVILSHLGYPADLTLAGKLGGIDAIVGGDSHTLLGDFTSVGLDGSVGPYPTVTRNRDGDPVCVVQAWEYGKAFGLLSVRFDDTGRVLDCRGEITLPIGDDFRQKNAHGDFVAVDADTRAQILRALQLAAGSGAAQIRVVSPDPQAQAELSRFASRLADMKKQRIGVASEALCLVRVPGEADNRSAGLADCAAANTRARGSDVAQAVAEAYRQASRRADIALQNGGGIRTALPAGEVSYETAHSVLPFRNVLYELPLSGRQLVAVLEEAVAGYLDRGGSDGAHPYAAGLRWHLDLSQPPGRRFSNLTVKRKSDAQWQALDPDGQYMLVTSDYLAQGHDGYQLLAKINASGVAVNTYLNYTQTFIDYLLARGTIRRPPDSEYSHQQVIARDGRRLP